MEMVQVLVAFTRAKRANDWDLYMYAFTRMLDLYMRYDHQKYAKWGVIFAPEMHLLPEDVKDKFRADGFGVQCHDNCPFTSVDVDHATEWVNGIAKSSGGLAAITHIDSATLRWVLAFHAR